MPVIYGTTNNDNGIAAPALSGTAESDTIYGLAGDDLIAGGDGGDILFGDEGVDTIDGGVGNDYLDGGLGNDILTDGLGTNTFSGGDGNDTITSSSQDFGHTIQGGAGDDEIRLTFGSNSTINGGSGNDTIVLRNSTGSLISGGADRDTYVLQTGALNNLISDFTPGSGGDVVRLAVNDLANYTGGNPFNTGHLRLVQSGNNTLVQVDADGTGSGAAFATAAVLQNVVATSLVASNFDGNAPLNDARNDFNGDGRSDLLLRHSSGVITNWLGTANGNFADNWSVLARSLSTSWQIETTGDYNGDGRDDLLLRHESGTLTNWLGDVNGGFTDNWSVLARSLSTAWQIEHSGDFNGDGRDDLLLRHESGVLTDWLGNADGSFTDNWGVLARSLSNAWQIEDTGDYNGDGRDDLLLRHESGVLTNWLGNPDGSFTDNWSVLARSLSTAWQIEDTGDFNGDGRDDLLLRHESGVLTNWLGNADGSFTDNWSVLARSLSNDWQVQPVDPWL